MAEPSAEPSHSPPRRRRWRRVFFGVFLFMILTGAAVWILAERYGTEFVRGQLETILTVVLERRVRVKELIVRARDGEFGVAGFALGKGPDSDESMVKLGKALITMRMPRLWPPEIVARIDIADLDLEIDAEPAATEATEESPPLEIAFPSTFEFGPLTLRLASARLDRGSFVYRDEPEGVAIGIRGIDAQLQPAGNGFGAEVSAQSLLLRFPGVEETIEQIHIDGAMDPERIAVQRLTLNYGGEPLEAEGAVLNPFTELALDLEIRGRVPLKGLNRYVKSADWQVAGLLELEGSVRGPIPALNASWTARVPELSAGRLSAADLHITGAWDSRVLRIPELRANLFGGALHGSFEMVPENMSETRANLRLADVSLKSLDGLTEKPLNLGGVVTLEAKAAGDPTELNDLRASVDIKGREIVLPDNGSALGAGNVAAEASLAKGSAELSTLSARWAAAEISANAKVDLAGPFDGRIGFAGNMQELARALRWKGVDGKAALTVNAKGDWQKLSAAGDVAGRLVSSQGSEIGRVEIPFSAGEETLRIPRAFIYLGQTRLESSVTAHWSGERRFDGKLEARPVRMEDLAIFMPVDLQPRGGFNLSARAEGTQSAWRAAGKLTAQELSVGGVSLENARISLSGNENQARIEELSLALNGVMIKGDGEWAWTGAGKVGLEVGPAELASIQGLPEDAGLRGTGSAVLRGSVNADAINASGEISVKSLMVQELALGEGGLDFTVTGSRLKAGLDFPGLKLSGRAEGKLAPGENVAAELALDGFSLEPVLAAFAPDLADRLSGQLTLLAQGSVPYDDPLKARGKVQIDPIRLEVEGEGLRNSGPIQLEAEGGSLRLKRLSLESTGGGVLQASGTLTQFQDVDFKAQLKLPLSLLAAFSSEIEQAGGALEVNAQVTGSVAKPVIKGGGRIADGSVALASYPDPLREINAEFAFTPKGGKLTELKALLGRGTIHATGQVGIEGLDVRGYQAKLTLRELPVAPLDGLRTSWNVDLEILGFGERGIIQGEANLVRGSYSRELSILSLLFEERASTGGGTGGGEPPPVDIALRVRVKLNDNFLVRTPLARLRVGGSVMVEGPVTQPVIFGTVAVQEGYITFQKRRFDLRRAEVNFVDPRQIDPSLDIEATSKIRQYDVTLQLSGRPQDLTITLSSDPSLPEEDLLSLVAFGVTREQFGRSAPGVLAGQAAQLIADDLFGSSGVLDDIDVDTQGDDGVTVGARLDEDTTVSFARGTGANGRGKIRIEHQLVGPLLIAGGRDLEGGFETDVVLRFRFR